MSGDNDPWRSAPQAPSPRPRRGLAWLVALAVVAGLAIWALMQRYPGAVDGRIGDAVWGAYLVALGVALLTRLRLNLGEAARRVGLWLAIIAVLVLGYSFRDELGWAGLRVRGEFAPGQALAVGPGEAVVARDGGGHFTVDGQVNGRPVRFLIDTGASGIVLSPADARRVGVDIDALRFTRPGETANGLGFSAPFTADSLEVAGVRLSGVEMAVNQAPMSISLLGMSFLDRLESFQVRGDRLYLRTGG